MDEENKKRPAELGDIEGSPTEELTEEETSEVAGGMFPRSGGGGGGAKQYIYKIPAPPAPFVPVPFPVGS